ncbi:hypothetical protein ABZ235_27420 [Streptomyces canus]|uniref:hypothetical protein n=1 Tax=Streptomyces canus TaxID=58343 RepID=UPI00339F766C
MADTMLLLRAPRPGVGQAPDCSLTASVLHSGWLGAVLDIADTPAPPTGSAATVAVHTSTPPIVARCARISDALRGTHRREAGRPTAARARHSAHRPRRWLA